MKRNYEGTIRLQGIGVVEGIKAKNLKVGDVTVWNYGGTETVKEIRFSKTGKTLVAVVECNGKDYERKMTAERIVCVKELNPAEEVEVAVEEVVAEESVEVEAVETAEEIARRIVANRPRRERKPAFQRWIERFIEEKGLDLHHEFTFEHDGNIHFITLGFLVELMIKAPKHEQEQIKHKVVYIDFKNADVMHFFNFLAGAYIKNNF